MRDASSEALALVAQGLTAAAAAGGGEPPGGGLSNPVLKLLFECLVEQRKDLNAAACAALGMVCPLLIHIIQSLTRRTSLLTVSLGALGWSHVPQLGACVLCCGVLQAAPYLGTLEPGLAKELVRKLGSSTFQAPAALAAALARTDPLTGEPLGLIKVSHHYPKHPAIYPFFSPNFTFTPLQAENATFCCCVSAERPRGLCAAAACAGGPARGSTRRRRRHGRHGAAVAVRLACAPGGRRHAACRGAAAWAPGGAGGLLGAVGPPLPHGQGHARPGALPLRQGAGRARPGVVLLARGLSPAVLKCVQTRVMSRQ